MNKYFRFLVVALVITGFTAVIMSSCTRGYGCPYKTQVSVKK